MKRKKRLLLISNSFQHGLGYLDHCEDAILSITDKKSVIAFFPYAVKDLDSYSELTCNRFKKMGLKCISVHKVKDSKDLIRSVDTFFVGGGNTFRLLWNLQSLKMVQEIRKAVSSGAVYIGSSAGANVAGVTIQTSNDMPILWPRNLKALSLVPFNINPHYIDPIKDDKHMGETRERRINEFHEESEIPVLAIREGAMLDIRNEKIILLGESGGKLFIQGKDPFSLKDGQSLGHLFTEGKGA